MSRSVSLFAALSSILLLMSSFCVLARTGGTFAPNPGSAAQIKAVTSTVYPSQVLVSSASPNYTGGDAGNQNGNGDGNKNGYGDEHKNGRGGGPWEPKPTPEPPTLLSFGAALLIGGGVLYSRRLRRNRK
jgi:hypothetical protein